MNICYVISYYIMEVKNKQRILRKMIFKIDNIIELIETAKN